MRILLIEDDPSTAESIELMLKKADLNTYVTDSGEEGIELAKLYDYDILILDLSLPDIDGYEVLRKLRLARIETPTLILSGMDGAGFETLCLGVFHVGSLGDGRGSIIGRNPTSASGVPGNPG